MPDTKSKGIDAISESLVRLIKKNGRYSKREILGLRAMGPIQMIDNGIFAISMADTIEKALDRAIAKKKIRGYRASGGYEERFGIPSDNKMIDDLRIIDTVYTVNDCRKCGRTAIASL